ncbi:lytic transglycosylase domain-containing protein [Altererythrobacter sp. CAU 1778]
MDRPRRLILAAAALATGTALVPTGASASSAEYFIAKARGTEVPAQLSAEDRVYYTNLFDAVDAEDWARVDSLLASRTDGPLHGTARAEYYLHANSPRVELPQIEAWLAANPNLPQAEQMAALGAKRGMVSAPYLPPAQSLTWQGSAPKRMRPRETDDGTMPRDIANTILQHIKDDDPDGARQLLDGIDAALSSSARAEWRQRVAWSYYIENRDTAALAMANTVGERGSGPWVSEGDWVVGLASWRLGDFQTAAAGFHRAASSAHSLELGAAAYYWASRAYVRSRQPEKAAEMLRGAARMDETLYGMLAAEQLGSDLPRRTAGSDFTAQDWAGLSQIDNVRVAAMLAELGRDELADQTLRHQARIGDPSQFEALSRLARAMGSPQTQLWMAHNAPRRASADPAARYPVARWQPIAGWKVDPALVYAHALQESNFRASVVSPAGARGLMQIVPAAARDHAGKLGVAGNARDLNQPEVNLAFGQEHLGMLSRSGATQGRLPKIMAAYNAGLTPVTRWQGEIRDQNDPLLWMESVPYWETREYVAIVMRNYWMYERQAAATSPSRVALAQGQWPGFPAVSASTRLSYSGAD